MKLFVLCALIGVLASPAYLQTKKTPAKTPRPSATPKKQASDKPEWDRVTAIADRGERIEALEKFVSSFPKSSHLTGAKGLIAATRVEAGNDDLAANNIDGAITEFKAAVDAVPTPVVQGFWDAGLSKIPANLYFRDRREAALDIAKTLELKATPNSTQLLSLATFYLTIEDGADAKRIADAVIAIEPISPAAYRIVGFAERMQFRLDDSATAFARAMELDPESTDAKMGLAEMKRALGKPDEALTLYEAVIAKDPENAAARTGHVLALFDADRRPDAEAEMAKLLEQNPGNFLLLGNAAYWYAAHNDGAKAVEFAQKAIGVEPRFIWSHIALARGLLLGHRADDAEKELLSARTYGNFPTLEYELAATRLEAGYYREAAEGLSLSFTIKDGQLSTALGGRVPRESKSFIQLLEDERRASIFAPTAADDADTAQHLAALLELKLALDAPQPDEKNISAAADDFVKGEDGMQAYRQIYAASAMVEKKVALQKAADLAKGAVSGIDAALAAPSASTAVMANELYRPRAMAGTRGEYVNVPDVPRATLSSILRGRIEDLIGWSSYQSGTSDEAVVRLRRAVSVLPPDSAWWRTSTWHLGAALAASGKDPEALDMYIRSYKGSQPDAIRYSVIEALYRKLNGTSEGLIDKIGENPTEAIRTVTPTTPTEATPVSAATPAPMPTPDMVTAIPIATPSPSPSPQTQPTAAPEPTPTSTPVPDRGLPTSAAPMPSPSPLPISTPEPTPTATPIPEPSPEAAATPLPAPSPEATPVVLRETPPAQVVLTDVAAPKSSANFQAKTRELFPPVVITIPSAKGDKSAEQTPAEAPITPCIVTVSSDSLRLNRSGGTQAVVVGRDDNGDITGLEVAGTPEIVLRHEPVAGVASRAIFIVRAVTGKVGLYQVTFTLPCGSKTIDVSVH
ncbi:MAG: tetratricopeptide repeat protein [Pyrinomonadaceae bacterium]